MFAHHVELLAWLGVGIGATARHEQGRGTRMGALQKILGVAGPVAIDAIIRAGERRAMTGVTKDDGAEVAVAVLDPQHRHFMIDDAVRIGAEIDTSWPEHASIDGKA